MVPEKRRAFSEVRKRFVKTVAAIKNVVAQNQSDRIVADERVGDEKGLGNALRLRLLAVINRQPPRRAIAEELAEARQIMRCGDETKLADAPFDERRERIINHRLVVDRLELLAR